MSTQDYGWSEAAPHSCGYIAPRIKTLVDAHTPRSVLDLGCGNGELLKILAAPERTVVGVEYDRGGAEIARHYNPGVQVFNLGVQDDPAPVLAGQPDKFDLVVSTEVIEHLYSPALLPRFAARVLKRGGGTHRQHALSRLSQESGAVGGGQVGRSPHTVLGWRPHQVLEPPHPFGVIAPGGLRGAGVPWRRPTALSMEKHDSRGPTVRVICDRRTQPMPGRPRQQSEPD